MQTINSKISQLPKEQKEWLLSIKNIYQTAFYANGINTKDLISTIELKAKEKGYSEIGLLLDADDLFKFFKNQ